MGIGRTNFLRLARLALAEVHAGTLKAVGINKNAYVNRKLGILFQKPEGWQYVYVHDFGELKKRQKLSNRTKLSDDEIWEEMGDHICVITKYAPDKPEFHGIFSPTITVSATPEPEMFDRGIYGIQHLNELSADGTAKILKKFKRLKTYPVYTVSEVEFHEFDAEYLFEHVELERPLLVQLKTIRALSNGIYYDFNFHQSNQAQQTAEKEFADFKVSIRLL